MKLKTAILTLSILVLGLPAFAESGGTWVSAGGDVHALHGNVAFFSEDGDADRFDLSDLRDGETRTFGTGARAVTVTRNGDTATITRQAAGDEVSRIDVRCELEQDTCTVLTFPDDPTKVMVAIEKERVCVNGEGDCDLDANEWVDGDAHVIVKIDCDGEDCEDLHALELDELSFGALANVTVDAEGGDGAHPRIVVRKIGTGDGETVKVHRVGPHGDAVRLHRVVTDQALLRCPEGDATLTVSLEEADETFLCPKHSVPMERVEQRGKVRVLHRAEEE